MRKTLLATALTLGMWVLPGSACGPSFLPELLSDRAGNLLELPQGMFNYEVGRLLSPADTLRVLDRPEDWSLPEEQRFDPETDGLEAAQKPLVAQMREAANPAAAEALGADLPASVRLYTAGAVAWHQGDTATAEAYFKQVLALPEAERRLRAVWAEFMLGRLRIMDGDIEAANAHFRTTRELRAAGLPDPHELAIAGWGTASAWYLAQDQIPLAVAGYAEEAARGSASGRASLLIVARKLLTNPPLLAGAIGDPLVQKLVSTYAYTRSGELLDSFIFGDEAVASEAVDGEGEADETATAPVGSPTADPTAVERVIAAVDAAGLTQFAGADRLAAAAYQAGRYALAERFLALAEGPLADWVKAKLKLRAGDTEAAAGLLAQAAKAFPAEETWVDPNYSYAEYPLKPQCRIEGEQGVLKLARGEYSAAAEHLFKAGADYWSDLAYVAERVLTVDELVALTSRLAPTYVVQPLRSEDDPDYYSSWPLIDDPNIGNQLRYLTARRLLRAGQGEKALAWHDRPPLKEQAQAYVKALGAGTSGDALTRAEALNQAADIARRHGMELVGFEGDPDYRLYGGSFDLNDPNTYDEEYNLIVNPRTDLKLSPDYTGADEKARLQQSRAQPLERFHYRHLAASHAVAAADLVPPRSQAFAALLCRATAYVIHRSPEAGAKIYRRYLDEGAFVPWGSAFGRGDSYGSACPAPDFAKVAAQQRAQKLAQLKRIAKYAAIPLLALVLGGIGLIWWRRRQRA